MTASLSLSLQVFPPPDKEKESLQYLIQRVNAQRGSFRNVTEQSLEEEIQCLEARGGKNDEQSVLGPAPEAEDATTRKEEVTEARGEILKQTGQALADTSMALEFVSLLLSKHNPATAQTTMSPQLKQALPLGCLGAEINQAPQVSELEKNNEEMVSIGWRLQSLNGAADSLLKSASRLEEEMGRETRYWEQVLAVKDKGWSLHRLPREKHTLGVRYGFAEAYSDFRDRGLAVLRRDEDGNLNLDLGIKSKGNRNLRVRILQQGKPLGSNLGGNVIITGDGSVEKELLIARDSIYDEELHHEIDREARNLVNQGVRCIEGNILLPYETTKQIEISLVPGGFAMPEEFDSSNVMPEAIALSLRILLSHAHRQNLQTRSKPPPPLREKKAPRPIYALLKPILEHLQQRSHVESTLDFLNAIKSTLLAAGIDIQVEQPTSSPDLRSLLHNPLQSRDSPINNLLQTLTSAPHTSFTLTFPTPPTTITLSIHTSIHPPHFGTTFHVAIQSPTFQQTIGDLPPSEHFTTARAFQTHLLHVVTLAVQQFLVSRFPEWRLGSAHVHTLVRNRSKGQGNDVVGIVLRREQLDLFLRESLRGGGAPWSWFGEGSKGDGERRLIDVMKSI